MEFDSYLTTSDAAKILKVTEAHIRYLCADGVIPSIKLGPRTIRIPAAEFKQWLDEKAMEKVVSKPTNLPQPADDDSAFPK